MFSFFSVHIFTGSYDELLKKVYQRILHNERFYICVTGVHGLVEAEKNRSFRSILNNARYTVPDGMPIVWAGKIQQKNIERIYGPLLMEKLCALSEKEKLNVYFYGTTPKTVKMLKIALQKKFSRLSIVGSYAPPFGAISPETKKVIYKKINDSQAHIVFVGLSTPKQELWMHEARPHVYAHVLIGVGAAFDFLSGMKRQAPLWVQHSGFEWLFRFIEEPRRLGKRYIINNSLFLWFLIRRLIKKVF